MKTSRQPIARRTLQNKIAEFIQEHRLLLPGEKVIVAVSGGADSVCLLHVLLQLKGRLAIGLHVAHLNHKLRGAESDADATYVDRLARKFGVPATIEVEDVATYHREKGGSLEEAARELRYMFLARVAREVGASKTAVGHTRNDAIETILLHLLRGTGTAGLRGLTPSSTLRFSKDTEPLNIIRPLLKVSREETIAYCQRHQLYPRSDSSNLSLEFFRNRIRLELLPLLRTYNPGIDDSLLRLATIAGDDVNFVEEQVAALWNGLAEEQDTTVYLDATKLTHLPPALQRQIFRKAVEKLKGNLKDIEADHIEAMLAFLKKPAGKKLSLPQGLRLFTEYGRLALTTLPDFPCHLPPLQGVFRLNIPGETVLPGWRVTTTILGSPLDKKDVFAANLDFDKCGTELVVRARQPGDRFQPLGMAEVKKLQDFMVDSRIPRAWRDRIPLVCSSGQVLWVVGWRISDRVKVNIDTRHVLHLKFERLE
jgi:tRNA(Ile)-lysidine synthase